MKSRLEPSTLKSTLLFINDLPAYAQALVRPPNGSCVGSLAGIAPPEKQEQ